MEEKQFYDLSKKISRAIFSAYSIVGGMSDSSLDRKSYFEGIKDAYKTYSLQLYLSKVITRTQYFILLDVLDLHFVD